MPSRYQPLPLGAIRPLEWLAAQCQRDVATGYLGVLDRLTPHVATDLFTQRIGAATDQHAWWDGESRGNWVWGLLQLAYHAANIEALQRMLGITESLVTSQDADGYIGIYLPAARYRHTSGDDGELWTQSRALLILLTAHALTHDARYLGAVQRCVALTMRVYGPHYPYFSREQPTDGYYHNYAGLTHGLCYCDVLAWLERLTGDATYRAFGRWLYDDFSAMPAWFIPDDLKREHLNHLHLPWGGHAVHTAEHVRALAWLASDADDATLHDALALALAKLRHYSTVSGALIGDEMIHGIPHATSGYEYCTLTEQLQSLCTVLALTGYHDYADWAESLTFNAAQGARLPDGVALSYLSQDTRLLATAPPLPGALEAQEGSRTIYSPTHEQVAVCCAPNMGRLIPTYIANMWMALTEEPGLICLLYGPAHIQTTIAEYPVEIQVVTSYPFELGCALHLSLGTALRFALVLRRPQWATTMQVIAPVGAEIQEEADAIWIRHTWTSADTVRIIWQTQVRLQTTGDGEAAFFSGPLQYVLPIAARSQTLRTYDLAPFEDVALCPQDQAAAYHLPLVSAVPSAWVFESDRARLQAQYPWDDAPCWLTWNQTRLVPMGTTQLRRATLPLQAEGWPHSQGK